MGEGYEDVEFQHKKRKGICRYEGYEFREGNYEENGDKREFDDWKKDCETWEAESEESAEAAKGVVGTEALAANAAMSSSTSCVRAWRAMRLEM